jgi:predicted house-cleaning noncanonical NTP pyrophosphatase (MazG superfamily)
MKLETFGDVLTSIKKNPKRPFHLLLGNGFSVAYDPTIFSYNALHDFVSKLKDKDLSKILEVIETRNFEVIMQYLDNFSALITAFGGDTALKKRIDAASAKLKKTLLDAVKEMHPEHVFKVPDDQSKACATFLKTFLDSGGSIFSTNYDLLLYWVLMRNSVVKHVDGCGRELLNDTGEFMKPEEQDWSDLMWGKHREEQNVFYLHGALPFFDSGTSVEKEEYTVYNYLLANISERMEKGEYPIFVTAGDASQKLKHITHNQYLTFCYDSFCAAKGSLVTFGFGFGQYDEHIIAAINRAAKQKAPDKLWSIYIGIYSEEDKKHIEHLAPKFRCKVHVFDAKTANVWGR